MQWFRFKVKVRNGRPTTRVPAKTNDLATVIGTSGSTNTQMAVAGLDTGSRASASASLSQGATGGMGSAGLALAAPS